MRQLWWLLPVLIIAGLWTWLAPRRLHPDAAASESSAQTADELGFAALDAELIETGADGAPLYRLRAQRIAQQRPDAAVELDSPQLSYDDRARGQWTLRATRGTLSADRHSVAFDGEVQARRTMPRSQPLVLRTATLQVDLQSRVADTAAPVDIEWGRAQLHAGGLHADMVSGLFVLNGTGHGQLRY
jgi:LPS export ABC transporter protein LptC